MAKMQKFVNDNCWPSV